MFQRPSRNSIPTHDDVYSAQLSETSYHGGGGGGSLPIDVPLQCADVFSFQVYDQVVNCPLQYTNGWGILSFDVWVAFLKKTYNMINCRIYICVII